MPRYSFKLVRFGRLHAQVECGSAIEFLGELLTRRAEIMGGREGDEWLRVGVMQWPDADGLCREIEINQLPPPKSATSDEWDEFAAQCWRRAEEYGTPVPPEAEVTF